ncbi:MAG: molecular chaperone HtpG, partial [Bacteroidales bacterium]|nr:molecular chaperone HtpG [Bacteroidales bacterium]
LDKDKGTITISDRGIGMTEEEIDKYINQIAFSGVNDFLEKYKDNANNIIGHFGLGFYSSFMVSKKVEIVTRSYKDGSKAVKWSCDGSPAYEIDDADKEDRGSDIILYVDDDCKEFLEKEKIQQLLTKYCKFMAVPVAFGKKQEWSSEKKEMVDTDKDNLINDVEPLWTKAPSTLKDEDYQSFYRTLYPMSDEPMFWIHLNVDYPFNLTGILYFPKLKDCVAVERNKISLYCNQMFVTDHVDNIVPDFMTLLHGVIDSPDIPLNVSRSYLQSDAAVKKISTYITKKVADRLEGIFKDERAQLEAKWDNLKLFIEYGMLSDEKFCERALKFALLKNTDGKYFSFDEYKEAVKDSQADKDKKLVYLYATKPEEQYAYIQAAKDKGYDVLLMDCELDSHYVNLLEQKLTDTRFARVDSDAVENLIPKEDKVKLEMKEDERYDLENLFKAVMPAGNDYFVTGDNLGADAAPILITQNEFMRRYREMSALGGGMNFYGSMPESYNVTVNMENPLVAKIWEAKQTDVKPQGELPAEAPADASEEEKTKAREAREAVRKAHRADVEAFASGNEILHQIVDLALLGNGMLKGKALSDFIARSQKVVNDAYLK